MINKSFDISETKSKIFVSLAVLIIVFIAIHNWVVSPQAAFLGAAQDYERVTKDTEHKIDILTRTIERLQGDVVRMKEFDAKKVACFFDIETGLRFLDNIESDATEFGCSVISLNYMLPKTIEIEGLYCDNLEVITKEAEIEVLGHYNNIKSFLERLNGNSDRVCVSNLKIETTDDFSAIKCNMKITIYIVEDKELISDVKN